MSRLPTSLSLLLLLALAAPPAVADPTPRLDSVGDPLPERAIARLGTIRFRAGAPVKALWFTPDGKALVSETETAVRTWETATGKPRHSFPLSAGYMAASPSPDGRLLALPTDGSGLNRIFELETAKFVCDFGAASCNYTAVAFSPDGKTLAALSCPPFIPAQASSFRVTIVFCDVATGKPRRSWNANLPNDGPLDRSAPRVIWAGADTILLHRPANTSARNADTGALRFEIPSSSDASSVAASPNGSSLALVDCNTLLNSSFIRLIDPLTGATLKTLPLPETTSKYPARRHRGENPAVAFSSDGETLIACDHSGALTLSNLTGDRQIHRSLVADDLPAHFALSPDGATLALEQDSVIHLLDVSSGNERLPKIGHDRPLCDAVFSGDGKVVVTAADDQVLVWDVASPRPRYRVRNCPDFPRGLKIARDGRTLLSFGYDDAHRNIVVQTWNLSKAQELHRPVLTHLYISPPDIVALSPNAETLVALNRPGPFATFNDESEHKLYVLNLVTGAPPKLIRLSKIKDDILSFQCSDDGRSLAGWSTVDNKFRHWQLSQRAGSVDYKLSDQTFAMSDVTEVVHARYREPLAALSSDDRYLFCVTDADQFVLCALDAGQEIRTGSLTFPGIWPLVFSPDARTIALCDPDHRTIHIIERATFTERQRFVTPQGVINSLNFSPDGKRLVAANRDATALIWDLVGTLQPGHGRALAPKDLSTLWTDLAASDGSKVQQAIQTLAASPREAIPYFSARLLPTPVPDPVSLSYLIAQLDAADFKTREAATNTLAALEETGLVHFRQALAASPPAETRRRLQDLIDKANNLWRSPTPHRLRLLRSLEILELAAIPDALRLLESLAKGDPSSWLTLEAAGSVERLRRRTP